MDLQTDYMVLKELQSRLRHPERTLLTDFAEPEEVQAEVGHCSLVVSSRLHLLILGLNRLVPGIGIAGGSKINSYLDLFDLPTAGTVNDINFPVLTRKTARYLHDNAFADRAGKIRDVMRKRLISAEKKLKTTLSSLA